MTDLLDLGIAATRSTGGVILPTRKPTPISKSTEQVDAILNSQAARELRGDGRLITQKIETVNIATARHEWNVKTRLRAKADPLSDLKVLSDMGFAWRDLARMLNVTVPAVRKWRQGERISTENKERIHRLAAACDCLAYPFEVKDIAGWFEMPLLDGVPVTPIDLWVAGKPDLVFMSADDNTDPEDILNKFDPVWQERYRSDFETFEAEDGNLSIRMKER
jgi:hypothetical protein